MNFILIKIIKMIIYKIIGLQKSYYVVHVHVQNIIKSQLLFTSSSSCLASVSGTHSRDLLVHYSSSAGSLDNCKS